MKKFLSFSRRQPSLDRSTVHRGGWVTSERFGGKSMRRISATSLNTKSIQVVRGAYNIDLNKVDSSFTKLHRACLLNDETQVRKQISKVDNNSHDSSHRYPLHLATVNGNYAIVKLLIENQANPNVQDNEGNTPLIKSIECGNEHLVKYLVNNGADPNISDLDNNTALHWAIMTESVIAVEALMSSKKCDLLLRNNKDETCLHIAVRSPLLNTPTFEAIIRAGSDFQAKDQLGMTAYNIAQACNNKAALKAFDRCNEAALKQSRASDNIVAIDCDNQKTARKLYDEYKLKYIAKNKENLEYEKRLIQLAAETERLKLEMSYMKEQHEKLESDYEQLSAENFQLKQDNASLLNEINETKQREAECNATPELNKSDLIDLNKVTSIECRGHEGFLVARAFLQDRINQSKLALI